MANISCGGLLYTVDHAVKGADYIHGYDAEGNLVVAFNGISDFSVFSYDGEYMNPEECLEENCNVVKHVANKLVRSDGTPIPSEGMLFVTVAEQEDGTYLASHNATQIYESVLAGNHAFLFSGTKVFTLTYASKSFVYFDNPIRGGLSRWTVRANNLAAAANLPQQKLTIGSVTYDGSYETDMTEAVKELINEQLGVIENGTY